ncbi:hypothetical protein FO519_006295 [Halicephalobus sp. NKZ332]|nr:hypothetical protein FO519_006295 [Halicephalobus sp. NKZ332]
MTVPQSSKDHGLMVEKPLRLASSTEGRFTILNEKNKDSESFDEDSYTDTDGDEFPQFSKSCVAPCPVPVDRQKLRLSHSSLPPMRFSGSMIPQGRFRTAPEDSVIKKYKKGRWECVEWQDPKENNQPRTVQNNLKEKAGNRMQHPPLIHEDSIFSFDQYDDSDRENLPEFSRSPPGNSLEIANEAPERSRPKLLETPSRNRYLAASPDFLSGRATPLEMQLHYGLERSLSGNGNPFLHPLSFEGRVGSPQSFRGSSVPPPDRLTQEQKHEKLLAKNQHLSELFCNVWYGQKKRPLW